MSTPVPAAEVPVSSTARFNQEVPDEVRHYIAPEVPVTFSVDEAGLRRLASALARTGAWVVAGAAQVPPPVTVPRWSAAEADGAAADASRDIAGAGDLLIATADDYRAADDRAAHRLRALR
jgi:hypothetical protein